MVQTVMCLEHVSVTTQMVTLGQNAKRAEQDSIKSKRNAKLAIAMLMEPKMSAVMVQDSALAILKATLDHVAISAYQENIG